MASAGSGAPALPKLRARDVTRWYGSGDAQVHALGPVDLTIASGEFICLVGPSGCGKSTFLRIAAGLLPPSEGEVEVLSESDAPVSAVVFQDYSIGMKQRVSIARALVTEPQILLMDEPFAALDAQLRHVLQDELLQLWQEDRRTVPFVTHNLDEALVLGDRVIVMGARPGTIVAEVPVPFDRPRTGDIRRTPEFAELESHIWDLLRGEISTPGLHTAGGNE